MPLVDDTEFATRWWRLRDATREGDVESLRNLLADPDVRGQAAIALGRLGDMASLGRILSLTRSGDPLVRSRAAQALGLLGAHESIDDLSRLAMHDETHFVRQWATQALGRIDAPESQDVLGRLLLTHDDSIQRLAAQALVASGRPEALTPVREVAVAKGWRHGRYYRKLLRDGGSGEWDSDRRGHFWVNLVWIGSVAAAFAVGGQLIGTAVLAGLMLYLIIVVARRRRRDRKSPRP